MENINTEIDIELNYNPYNIKKLQRLRSMHSVQGDILESEEKKAIKELIKEGRQDMMQHVNLHNSFVKSVQIGSDSWYLQSITDDNEIAWTWDKIDLSLYDMLHELRKELKDRVASEHGYDSLIMETDYKSEERKAVEDETMERLEDLDIDDLSVSQTIKEEVAEQIKDELPDTSLTYYVFCKINGVDHEFDVGREAKKHAVEQFIERVYGDMQGHFDVSAREHHEDEWMRENRSDLEEELAQDDYGRSLEDLTEEQKRSVEESALHEGLERARNALYESDEYEDRRESYRDDARYDVITKWVGVIEDLQDTYDDSFEVLSKALMKVAVEEGESEDEVHKRLDLLDEELSDVYERAWESAHRSF